MLMYNSSSKFLEAFVFVTITRPPVKDDEKRALYVAMTRAIHKLILLSNGNFFLPISMDVAFSVNTTP
ncbi:MAG: hypothetical protein WBP41_08955 [Saprospiraceae bacterium]